jgi:DNA-binding transcriptional LysR family regulator
MELRALKRFLTVARDEDITKAAAPPHGTQPSPSRQIMRLQDEKAIMFN